MINALVAFVDEHVPDNWKYSLYTFFAGMTILDFLDFAWRIVTGLISLFLFYFAWRRHRQKMTLMKKEEEKLDLEIYERMQRNKK